MAPDDSTTSKPALYWLTLAIIFAAFFAIALS